jgi:hypothetical protein
VTFGGQPGCGDYQPLGPAALDSAGDLTGTFYGADRSGGSMSFMARSGADHGTMWALTSAGRIFVSHNVNAADPAAVTWHRIDNATSPERFPSGVTIDPEDSGHAWVTYSGYNGATPTTPGHVFEVSENGSAPGSGIFTNLDVESGSAAFPTPFNNGDLPVADIVRDDATHTLYVATDFGVLRGVNDGDSGWHTTEGMPALALRGDALAGHLALEAEQAAVGCQNRELKRAASGRPSSYAPRLTARLRRTADLTNTTRGPARVGPLGHSSRQRACERLKPALLPFEPTALPDTLAQRPTPAKVTRNDPEALASTVRLVRPTSATCTRSFGAKPVPFT